MLDAFGLLITGILLVTGAIGIVSPGTLCDLESGPDIPPGPPSDQRLREMRIQCLVMVILGCVGIYAILTAVGPADGPLF
jgi:hypothetical protein